MGGETETQMSVWVDVSSEERMVRRGCRSDREPGWVGVAGVASWTFRNGMEWLVEPLASAGSMRAARPPEPEAREEDEEAGPPRPFRELTACNCEAEPPKCRDDKSEPCGIAMK